MNKIWIIAGYITALGVLAMFGGAAPANAADKAESDQKQSAAVRSKVKEYHYVAQPGDSYSQMVRKAVQTYGIINKKELGEARIVAIETWAAAQAGWPLLSIGQSVTFKEEVIKDWIVKAEALTDEELAGWTQYTANVYFDTRHVGEQ